MINLKVLLLSIALPTSVMFASAANAALGAAPTAGVATASLKVVAPVVVAGAGVVATGSATKSTWTIVGGFAIAAGGLGIGFIDPAPATFYDGVFTFHYPSTVMRVSDYGWLGSWGEDPSLLPPSPDTVLWPIGTTIVLQDPNSELSASVLNDAASGLMTVSFDWGSSGHAADATEPFNLFAALFEFTTNAEITFLGDSLQAPPGANFFVSSTGFRCTLPPPEPPEIVSCGESVTQYYRVVPEPGTIGLVALAFAFCALGVFHLGAVPFDRIGRRVLFCPGSAKFLEEVMKFVQNRHWGFLQSVALALAKLGDQHELA